MTAFKQGAMDQLKIEFECNSETSPGTISAIKESLPIELGFRVEVDSVAPNSLPRFEAKGKRFVDLR
jgi:phenylacetate-coenzyme A ligase PaaK-like adenylate-forming protein